MLLYFSKLFSYNTRKNCTVQNFNVAILIFQIFDGKNTDIDGWSLSIKFFRLLKTHNLASQYGYCTYVRGTMLKFIIDYMKVISYYQDTAACKVTALLKVYNLFNLTGSTHVSHKSFSYLSTGYIHVVGL